MRQTKSSYSRYADRTLLKRLCLAALTSGLMACQTTSDFDASRAEAAVKVAGYASAASTVELPLSDNRSTSVSALIKLTRALDKAYRLLDLEAPFPTIQIVSGSHHVMDGRRVGVAAITAGGEEMIFFEREHLTRSISLDALVLHEVAHLKTWRLHGHDVLSHGREFKRICQSVTYYRNCTKQGQSVRGR